MPASDTNVSGGKFPSHEPPRSSTVKRRNTKAPVMKLKNTPAGTGGIWRFYTDDSPGVKVGPVPVLVMSLLFIASVFMLHIWGKYTRS